MGIPNLRQLFLPLVQRLRYSGACLGYHVWRLSFTSTVSTLYETCDWITVRNNGVFAVDVAEYISLIFLKILWSNPFHSPALEKYQLVERKVAHPNYSEFVYVKK